MLSRRHLLALGGAAGAGLLLPRRARASEHPRCFLFVFCSGGWDTTMVFNTSSLSEPVYDLQEGGVAASVGALAFVDHEERPTVRSFLEAQGTRTAFVNGVESRNVAHDVCTRLMLTNEGAPGPDDWMARLASGAEQLPLPAIHFSGPLFVRDHAALVARAGAADQLYELLGDKAIDATQAQLDLADLEDAFVARVAQDHAAEAGRGWAEKTAAMGLEAERRMQALDDPYAFRAAGGGLSARAELALNAFSSGLSRAASASFLGVGDYGWDTHGGNSLQSLHFELLFQELAAIVEMAGSLPGPGGGSLDEDLCICVLSEMGRFPRFNGSDGREHWTFTSAMLWGSGVAGGQVVGGYGPDAQGQPTELSSGQVHDSGEMLLPGHLGATLLALGDVDPGELGHAPIAALLA